MRSWKLVLLIIALVVVAPDLMAQCAMCRGTVESTVSNGRSVVASDLNLGILYLLLAPYLIVASIGYLWYRNSKLEHGRRIEIAGRVKRAMSQM
ncbi:hypothetical protein [Spirosoma foliorum]|uniref:Uncharacterized protein n=1 Tax=Spirosoma foliorum TaxID=2710596 RepID=A0A7G5GUH9_9BACT|nr:hypothetical protein [Spirosoma foliorum]QMW02521.1 hypothetical protein H3H32_32205 [Spirosoma foliorum]